MSDRIVSIRLPEEEFIALKTMAKREVRTMNCWLRSKIVQEAQNLRLLKEEKKEVDASNTI